MDTNYRLHMGYGPFKNDCKSVISHQYIMMNQGKLQTVYTMKKFIIQFSFKKVSKRAKIDQWPKMHVFCISTNNSNLFKKCENEPKSIKSMGYSPCFLVKNGQKCMFLNLLN
jgi:hypothetical protein